MMVWNRRSLRRLVLELLADGHPRPVPVIARLVDQPQHKVQMVVWNARRDGLVVSSGDKRGSLYTLAEHAHRLAVLRENHPPLPCAGRQWFQV